jgi:ribosomal protein S5
MRSYLGTFRIYATKPFGTEELKNMFHAYFDALKPYERFKKTVNTNTESVSE